MCKWGDEVETLQLKSDQPTALQQAAQLLRNGEPVAFPTDTVYGLGANALDSTAVNKIYTAKGRPEEKPLLLLIHDRHQLQRFVREIPAAALPLMDAFWPGPLTLVFPLQPDIVAPEVTRGLDTIGVRMPNHETALELLRLADVPIAAPSANLSGNPSPTTAAQVADDLNGHIAAIVDGGACEIGEASTIVDMTTMPPTILRQGAVTKAQLEQTLGITL